MRHRPVRLPGPEAGRRDRALRGARGPTHVGSLWVDIRIPLSHSLKDKRAVITSILEGARRRFEVAAAEVAYQDQWQRSALGFAAVASTESHAAQVLQRVERFVWSFPEVDVIGSQWGWLD